MLEALATLLVFQAIGEVLSYLLRLPVPGPVLGMALLLGLLLLRPATIDGLRPTSLELLKHLSLLFVPAGVGVMLHVARIGNEWLPIVVSLLVSTALAIAVTGRGKGPDDLRGTPGHGRRIRQQGVVAAIGLSPAYGRMAHAAAPVGAQKGNRSLRQGLAQPYRSRVPAVGCRQVEDVRAVALDAAAVIDIKF